MIAYRLMQLPVDSKSRLIFPFDSFHLIQVVSFDLQPCMSFDSTFTSYVIWNCYQSTGSKDSGCMSHVTVNAENAEN